MPMPAAAATSSGMRQAPSPNEKLVCVCRWTKLMPARSVERPLERPRLGDAVVAQVEHASRGAHAPVRAAHAAAVLPPARLDDPRLEHTLDAVVAPAPGEGDREALPLVPGDGDGDSAAAVLPPARLDDPRLEHTLDAVVAPAPGEGDREALPLVPGDGDGDCSAAGGGSAAGHVVLLAREGRW